MIKNYLLILFVLGALCNSIYCTNYKQEHTCMNPFKYGFIHKNRTEVYYHVSDLQLSWFEAELLCRSYGAHLPSVIDRNENKFLRKIVERFTDLRKQPTIGGKYVHMGGYWLGGYLSFPDNQWKWIDGRPFTYMNWDRGQPEINEERFIADTYNIKERRYVDWHTFVKARDKVVICQLDCTTY